MADLQLTDAVIKTYTSAQVHENQYKSSSNSLSFHVKGERCVVAFDSGDIVLYDVQSGIKSKEIKEANLKAAHINFTHHDMSVLFASNNQQSAGAASPVENNTINYVSLHDNQYLHKFQGHESQVTSLATSSTDSTFISASLSGQVRLWDLKSPTSTGKIELTTGSVVAVDPQTAVFAVASGTDLLLYDMSEYQKGPFEILQPGYTQDPSVTPVTVNDLQFSLDGRYLLATTNQNQLVILDAFDCQVYARVESDASCSPSCSPDSKYVITSVDKSIHVYSLETERCGAKVATWDVHQTPIGALGWAPNSEAVVSVCDRSVVFWLSE